MYSNDHDTNMQNDMEYLKSEIKIPNDLPSKKKYLYMDEAIAETKFGAFNYTLIFLSSLIILTGLSEKKSIGFVFPVSECDLNLTASEKGFLGGVSSLGMICSFYIWGFLADTIGRRRIILPTLFITFLTSLASSFSDGFYVLTAFRFLNGFFISASSATVFVYFSEFHNKNVRARAMLVSSVLAGAFSILVPMSAWIVINQSWEFEIPFLNITYKPWRLFIIVCALPGLISFFMLMFLPESPKFLLDKGKEAKAHRILKTMNRWNNGKRSNIDDFELCRESILNDTQQTVMQEKPKQCSGFALIWNQTVPLFQPPLLYSTIFICFVQFSIYYVTQGMNMFTAYILNKMALNLDSFVDEKLPMCDAINMKPLILNGTFNESPSELVCVTKLELGMIYHGMITCTLYTVFVAFITLMMNKISNISTIIFLLLLGGTCGIVCMWTDLPLLQIAFYTTLMVTGVAQYVLNTLTVELYPTSLRAMAVCMSMLAGRLGCILGSYVTSLLLENHCEVAFYSSGTILIAAALLTFSVPKTHKKVPRI